MIHSTMPGRALRCALLLASCTLFPACVGPYPGPYPGSPAETPSTPGRPDLKVDLHSIAAPVREGGSEELLALAHDRGSAPAQLRRAHIYTETGQSERAVLLLSTLLRGSPRPSPAVESHALYLRARAHERQGHKQQAIADCRGAAALAMDPGLRSATDAMLQRYGVSAVAKAPADRPRECVIRDRAGWGADPPRRDNIDAMGRIYRITVHHSANLARSSSLQEAIRAIKLDQRYHMATKGWADIGYHYLIDPAGRIWEGRDLRWQGAHAGNGALNRGNIGVCLLGNFTGGRAGQAPSDHQVRALRALLEHLSRTHDVRQDNVFTHRELQGVVTACPGSRLQRVMDLLRRDMVAATPPLATTPGTAATPATPTMHPPGGGDE